MEKEGSKEVAGTETKRYSVASVFLEASHSGLVHCLGKTAYRKVSEVQILSPPLWLNIKKYWGQRQHTARQQRFNASFLNL